MRELHSFGFDDRGEVVRTPDSHTGILVQELLRCSRAEVSVRANRRRQLLARIGIVAFRLRLGVRSFSAGSFKHHISTLGPDRVRRDYLADMLREDEQPVHEESSSRSVRGARHDAASRDSLREEPAVVEAQESVSVRIRPGSYTVDTMPVISSAALEIIEEAKRRVADRKAGDATADKAVKPRRLAPEPLTRQVLINELPERFRNIKFKD